MKYKALYFIFESKLCHARALKHTDNLMINVQIQKVKLKLITKKHMVQYSCGFALDRITHTRGAAVKLILQTWMAIIIRKLESS